MSERKTYVVTLHKGIDYDDFYRDMEIVTSGHPFVPDRIVDILNENPMSDRNTHYALTDEEAIVLSQDPRVMAVEVPPQDRDDLIIGHTVYQDGNFNKISSQTSANYKNWGLLRSAYATNIYGAGTSDNGYVYPYHLDGTGVDVVIHDSGLEVDHPEFLDSKGNSRVQRIDWYVEAGLYSSLPSSVDFSTSTRSVICTNSHINVNYSSGYFNFGSIGAAILLGARDAAADYIGTGQDDGGRSYRVRLEGTASYLGSAGSNTLMWETKFLDNGWIQVLMLRHDSYFDGPFRVQDWSGNTVADMSWFSNAGLSGGVTPMSAVLTTTDGQSWSVNTNTYAILSSGSWVVTAGVATAGGQTGLTSRSIAARDDSIIQFNTPFSVPFISTPVGSGSPQNVNHYRDYDGHGTHVAGIAAGKTFGWAKGARIYSLKVSGLEGTGDSGTGISTTDCFNVVKLWHRNKPVDPVTGHKRPTVVNMSWGYGVSASPGTVTNGSYRGTLWTTTTPGYMSASERWTTAGITNGGNGRWSTRIASVDADVQDLADEGVIVCIAAGNNYDYQDVPSGANYNNYLVYGSGTLYYHRGASPHSTSTFSVGCIDYDTIFGQERVAYFSCKGPGTNIWAPGRYIVSSTSNLNTHGGVTYYDNPNYYQLNISGTSMASPQIAGMSALYLQVNPTAKFAEVYDFMSKNSKPTLFTTNSSTDYTNYSLSLMGSENKFAFMPFASDIGIKVNATRP